MTRFSLLSALLRVVSISIFWVVMTTDLLAQTPRCVIWWGMINSDRHVAGEVNAECPPSIHSTGWGNWGVSSNVGQEHDGDQFQGYCADDNHLQWNSCTQDHLRTDCATDEPPPQGTGCYWYNAQSCSEQHTSGGGNAHAGGYDSLYVSCPSDLDYDTIPDVGGCMDISSYGITGNFMSLYELDWEGDEFITTLYFPSECCVAEFSCGIYGCGPAASDWFYNNYSTNPVTGVSAAILTLVGSATFYDDPYNSCTPPTCGVPPYPDCL